ncbi:MAG: secretion protein F, partial [Clostridia bacterium]
MQILTILFGSFVALGLFLLTADLLKLPTLKTSKAIASASQTNKKKVSSLDVHIANLTLKLSKFIKLNEYKEIRLKNTLIASGINKTPQEYTANAIVKALLIGIFAIPCLIIFPLLSPVFVVLSILIYFKETQKADNMIKEKREKIENELPRFVSTITQELKNSRDVLKILDNYKHSASEDFAKEL